MSAPDFGTPPASLSDAISKLMANPEILSTVASALGNMNAPKDPPAAEAEGASKAPDTDDFSPTGEASAATASAGASAAAGASFSPDLGELIGNLAPMMSRLGSAQGSHKDSRREEKCEAERREALLCALKPYVSEGRREAIDYIIRISQISDILKNLQH